MTWLPAAALLAALTASLVATLRIHRYSRSHIVAQLTIAGRGVYFSRTPDGDWWKLRLRRRCPPAGSWPPPDDPPRAGVREPCRPRGPDPLSTAIGLERP